MAVDVSKMTLDTPVLIKIVDSSGIYVPELNTYTPLETYASVEQIISIMNRMGENRVNIEFPKQSRNCEISKKIEEILLDYMEATNIAREKNKYVGTDVNNALDFIQDINDSHVSEEEIRIEKENKIFEYRDIVDRIVRDLSDTSLKNIFNSDDFISPEDRLDKAERENKSRARVDEYKSRAYEYLRAEADSYYRLSNDKSREYDAFYEFIDIDFAD